MATWVVTGGSGFLGRHLLAVLKASGRPGTRIIAIGRRNPDHFPRERFAQASLDDPEGLFQTIRRIEPDVLFHLAGLTPPACSRDLYRTNLGGTIRLLDALQAVGRPVRVVVVGSAAELGPVPVSHLPADEDCPCRPVGAYGLSKWFSTKRALSCRPPLEVVVARVFNPIGPGLPRSQVFGRIASALAEAGPGTVRLSVCDLDSRRDFLDARDVASALITLAIRGRAGQIYHVGSGKSRRVRDGLDSLISLSRRRVELIHQIVAPLGPADSRANIDRIQEQTGWSPRIGWEQSLADLWDSFSRRVPSRRVA